MHRKMGPRGGWPVACGWLPGRIHQAVGRTTLDGTILQGNSKIMGGGKAL